jgi:hypothetical protein
MSNTIKPGQAHVEIHVADPEPTISRDDCPACSADRECPEHPPIKPVVMTCCDSRYVTVAESMGHECPMTANVTLTTEQAAELLHLIDQYGERQYEEGAIHQDPETNSDRRYEARRETIRAWTAIVALVYGQSESPAALVAAYFSGEGEQA